MNIKNSNNIAKGNKTAYTKFKGLIGHNARTHEHYENENINPERTRDNLDYTNEAEALANYDRLSQENYHLNRKDTVMFEAITISLPPELKHENGIYSEEEKEVNKIFFDACIESMCEQITPGCKRMELSEDGTSLKTTYDNLISANVHYDETTPHLHLIVAPLVRDYNRAEKYVGKEDCPYQIHEADGNQFIYKYSNKEACGKEFYQHAHERLQNDVEKALGVKVTIYDEERAKSNRHVSHEDYLNEHHEELTSIKLKQAEAQLNASQSELKDAREQLNKLELKYDRVIDD